MGLHNNNIGVNKMNKYPELVVATDLENEDDFAIVPKGQENSNMHTRYGVCGRKKEAILFAAAPKLLEALEKINKLHWFGADDDLKKVNDLIAEINDIAVIAIKKAGAEPLSAEEIKKVKGE